MTGKALTYDVRLMQVDMARKGWLRPDLAREAGVSAVTVGRFLKAESQTARTAKKLSFALGFPIDRYIRVRRRAA